VWLGHTNDHILLAIDKRVFCNLNNTELPSRHESGECAILRTIAFKQDPLSYNKMSFLKCIKNKCRDQKGIDDVAEFEPFYVGITLKKSTLLPFLQK
jgi:hypothetical protein